MKKFLNFICANLILGLSTSQVLSCNNTLKSNLTSSYYNENSLNDTSALGIHGLKGKDSIQNLKNVIYQYILKKYNAKHALKTITLADVKNDLSIEIFDAKNNHKIINVQNFKKYSVLITAKKDAKYFLGANNKDKFIVDLTQLNLDDFVKNYHPLPFINKTSKDIKTNIEQKITDWYNQKQAKTFKNFDLKTVEDNLKINVISSKDNSKQQLGFSYSTKTNNEKYFFDVKKHHSKPVITDNFGVDFANLDLDNIYSALNGQDLYNQLYTQIAKTASLGKKIVTAKQIQEDINKNLFITIYHQDRLITPKTLKINYAHKWTLKVNITNNDPYFLPIPLTKPLKKDLKFSKLNLINVKYENYNFANAKTLKAFKQQTAKNLAKSYNDIFLTKFTAADILNDANLTWFLFDKTAKKFVAFTDSINYDHDYTISLKLKNNDRFFDNRLDDSKSFLLGEYTLNTNNITKSFNLKNINVLTNSKDFYNQVYQNLVNEYNHFYQGKRTLITCLNLQKDQNLHVNIKNKDTQKFLDENDTTNSLKIKTHYQVDVNIDANDLYFQSTQATIIRIINLKKLLIIDKKYFDLDSKKYSFKRNSQVRNYLYHQLASYYNSKLNPKLPKITINNLMTDRKLKVKIINGKPYRFPKDEVNYNASVKYYLTTTNNDQYFGKFTNFNLGRFSYQSKIDLGTKEAHNYINNEEKYALNNKNITKSDVIRWFMQYVNATKQFKKTLTWDMVAVDKDSIQLQFNTKLYLFDQNTPTFIITVNNSSYLKAGTFTFLEKNLKINTRTIFNVIPALKKTHWAYNDLWYYVHRTPRIYVATNLIATFEFLRIYNAICKTTCPKPPIFTKTTIHKWINNHTIEFKWTKNNDGKYLSPNEKIWNYGPTYYQIFVFVHKPNRLFSQTTQPTEIMNFYFSYNS